MATNFNVFSWIFSGGGDSREALSRLMNKGRAARDKGAWRRAERCFAKANAMAQRIGAFREAGDALFILSGLRLMEKDLRSSHQMARDAADIYDQIGEAVLKAQAERLVATAKALSR